jgi:hypothetical protein
MPLPIADQNSLNAFIETNILPLLIPGQTSAKVGVNDRFIREPPTHDAIPNGKTSKVIVRGWTTMALPATMPVQCEVVNMTKYESGGKKTEGCFVIATVKSGAEIYDAQFNAIGTITEYPREWDERI